MLPKDLRTETVKRAYDRPLRETRHKGFDTRPHLVAGLLV